MTISLQGPPPWLLWGNTQEITAFATGGASAPIPVSGQLAKISYKRPETWHWVFEARLLDGPVLPALGSHASVQILFDLTVGVGRSSVTLVAFEQFVIRWHGPANPPIGTQVFSTSVFGPNRIIDPLITPNEVRDNFIDQITAEDIQLACRVIHQSTIAGTEAKVEVDAHFAPKNHIRPEWLGTAAGTRSSGSGIPRFPAGEDKGS